MAQLAIRGHATRGSEVIELLEMLGGINSHNLYGDENYAYYTIDGDKEIKGGIYVFGDEQLCHFTLEEFFEKFPYKVGDKVIDIRKYRIAEIYGAHWSVSNNCTYYDLKRPDNTGFVKSYKFLQPYKEETMEEQNEKSVNHVFSTEIISFDIAQRDKYELDLQGKFEIILREGKYFVERIKPRYPKTYEECCMILQNACMTHKGGYKGDLIQLIQKLIICRDAYWKIAGEQMGLGKPWEPNDCQIVYSIGRDSNRISLCNDMFGGYFILEFPTKEMRDAFFENFKELIELVKELL